jgi:hypothetical protein
MEINLRKDVLKVVMGVETFVRMVRLFMLVTIPVGYHQTVQKMIMNPVVVVEVVVK